MLHDEQWQMFCLGSYIQPVQKALTKTELKVYNMHNAGYDCRQIADRLNIQKTDNIHGYLQTIKNKGWL